MPIRRIKQWKQTEAMLFANAKKAVAGSAIVVQREVKQMLNSGNSQRGANPSPPGLPPHKSSGHLARSYQVNLTGLNERNPRARVGSNLKYARIHEYGGLIHARKKLLTVPLNQTARNWAMRGQIKGAPLKFVPARKGGNHNIVGYLALTVGLTKGGKKAKGKAALPKQTFMFALMRRVFMPARPYVRRAAKKARPKIRQLFHVRNLIGVTHLVRANP